MIDIHSHILYGVDDGSVSKEESIQLLKKAHENGIDKIIATPHKDLKYNASKETILERVEILNQLCIENKLGIKVLPGQEVRLYNDLITDLKKNELVTLNNENKYILIEFPSSHVPKYATRILYELQLEGVRPIIVHPERNDEIIKNPNILYDFINNGALSQVTAGSFIGKFGRKAKKTAKILLENELITFIASDAHHLKKRDFHMQSAKDKIYKKYGFKKTSQLFNNANKILSDDFIIMENPLKPK